MRSASPAQHAIEEDEARRWARRPAQIETVLLLDPDEQASQRLVEGLCRLGIRLQAEREPFRAIAHASAGNVDLLIASAHLGARQLETLVTVARQDMAIPVLLAHGAGDTEAIGPAVLAGGQPAIALPYDAHEVARVLRQALPTTHQGKHLQLGALAIFPDSFDVSFAGTSIDLSPQEFALLVLLARHASRAVARQALTSALWADSEPVNPDDVLGAAISRIRRKFKPLGIEEAIHTVRGFGYRLNEAVLAPSAASKPVSARP